MLEIAEDPMKPDWRIISARGTVLAKQGQYKDAIPFFERAQSLAPDQQSVLNNLALAYTMNGDAAKMPAHSEIDMLTQNGSVNDRKTRCGGVLMCFAAQTSNSGSLSQSKITSEK